MSLLDLYTHRTRKTAEGDGEFSPYLFAFTANFRNILKFEDGFLTYSKICAMDADQFAAYANQNPTNLKGFMTNMRRTKLFAAWGDEHIKTAKGEVYERFLHERLNRDDERWFMNYLFIADSYFCLEKNYIFARTARIFDKWQAAGYTVSQIYNCLIYLFNVREGNKEEYLRSEYLVMLAFIDDPEFLHAYRTADEFERGELHDYIVDNLVKARYSCIVSEMLSPQSLTDCDTILDDAKLLFFSHYLMNSRPTSLEDFIEIFSQVYTRFYKLNTRKATNFIMMYEDVFRMTYLNLFSDLREFNPELADDEDYEEPDPELFSGYIDYTTTESLSRIEKINAVLSHEAKRASGYKCALDKECGCRYFLSKKTEKPYLEIHQLIPREYAGEFNVSLERPDNFVALCPHCHSLIHNATDEERFRVLSIIYSQRKDELDRDGIIPSNELMFAIYGMEQKKLPGASFFNPRLDNPQPKLAAGKGKSTAKNGKRAKKPQNVKS